jgi:DNA-binding NarL/FixJ family response regulator
MNVAERQRSSTIRVAVIEDHDDFREGLAHMIQYTEGFRCIGSYASVEEAVRKLPSADVVLMDVGLPGVSGIEGVPLVRARCPAAQIIMLTVFEDERHIFDAIRSGANGYLLKKTPPARIMDAIAEAASGGLPMTPQVARQVVELFRRSVPPIRTDNALSPREREVLQLLVEGLNYRLIGERLFISIETVRNHIRHIYDKLHVHSRTEAVVRALRDGLT